MVDNRGLNDLVKEVSVPLEDVVEVKENGQKKIVQRKKFPGYVLLKMIMNDENMVRRKKHTRRYQLRRSWL